MCIRDRSHISVLSFGLHTRLLSYGRFCSSIKLTGFCYRPPVCASGRKCSTNVVLLCRCTCSMRFATGPPSGRSTNGNQQRLLNCIEFVSFYSLVFNAEAAPLSLTCKYPNDMHLPFVRTWHAFKSPALLRDDSVLCNWSAGWLTRLDSLG